MSNRSLTRIIHKLKLRRRLGLIGSTAEDLSAYPDYDELSVNRTNMRWYDVWRGREIVGAVQAAYPENAKAWATESFGRGISLDKRHGWGDLGPVFRDLTPQQPVEGPRGREPRGRGLMDWLPAVPASMGIPVPGSYEIISDWHVPAGRPSPPSPPSPPAPEPMPAAQQELFSYFRERTNHDVALPTQEQILSHREQVERLQAEMRAEQARIRERFLYRPMDERRR